MKTIIFDFDGVIADSYEIGMTILNDLLKKHAKRDLTAINSVELKNMDTKSILKYSGIPFWRIPKIVKSAKIEINKQIENISIFNHIKESINSLNELYQLGIVSTNSGRNIKNILINNNINHFSFIYSGTSLFGKEKIIKKAISTYRIKKDEAIFVGDEVRDIIAAQKSGIRVVAVTWGYDSKPVLENNEPDFIADTPYELVKILKSA